MEGFFGVLKANLPYIYLAPQSVPNMRGAGELSGALITYANQCSTGCDKKKNSSSTLNPKP